MKWTQEEKNALYDRDLTHKELSALLPNRSINSIRRKTYQLGLQRSMKSSGRIPDNEADQIWDQPIFRGLINGHLLGDGCIDNLGYAFRIVTIRQDYAIFLQKQLNRLSNKTNSVVSYAPVQSQIKGVYFWSSNHYLSVCCCKHIFWEQRQRWYPGGTKKVPKDLVLSPLIINRWYIDDGTLRPYQKRSGCAIELCTDGFDDDSIDFLRSQITHLIGIQTGIRIVHGRFKRITIYTKRRVADFLNYIGEAPVESYKYKWRYSD